MGLFKDLLSKQKYTLYAPMNGNAVPLFEVPDPAFSGEMLGRGVAIVPTDGRVYAPCGGTVDTVFPTGHAITLLTDWGGEILIHVGLETVALEGKAFTLHTTQGERVEKGQLLLEADLDGIRAAGLNPITPILVCNWQDFASFRVFPWDAVTLEIPVMELKK